MNAELRETLDILRRAPRRYTTMEPTDREVGVSSIPAPRVVRTYKVEELQAPGTTYAGDGLWDKARNLFSRIMPATFNRQDGEFAAHLGERARVRNLFEELGRDPRHVMVVARSESDISGFALAAPIAANSPHFALAAICVSGSSQREGIGLRLYNTLVSGVAERDGQSIRVNLPRSEFAERLPGQIAGLQRQAAVAKFSGFGTGQARIAPTTRIEGVRFVHRLGGGS